MKKAYFNPDLLFTALDVDIVCTSGGFTYFDEGIGDYIDYPAPK